MDSSNNNSNNSSDATHERKVSWSDLLTKLKAENDQKKQIMRQMQSKSKISLGDVIASKPVEQEAETHIMRAVEKVASGSGSSSHNETDRLYKDIAADEISRASRGDESNDYDDDVDDDEAADIFEPAPPTEVPHGRPRSQSSLTSNNSRLQQNSNSNSNANSNTSPNPKSRFKSLVKKHIADNHNNSVEHTLFGLTAALQHMDEEKKKKKTPASATKNPSTKSFDSSDVDIEAQDSTESAENDKTQSSDEGFTDNEASDDEGHAKKQGRRHKGFFYDSVTENIEENWGMLSSFVGSRKAKAKAYGRKAIMYIMLPSLAISAFLFYLVENPSLCEEKVPVDEQLMATQAPEFEVQPIFDVNGTFIGNSTMVPTEEPENKLFVCPGLGASVSWWFLFLGVRQIVTFTLALLTQALIVDYLALASRFCLAWFGPVVTLFLVQAKGWPFIAVFWAIYRLILLSGDRDYAHHWGYWQDWVGLFNEENPSGNVVDHEWNNKILRLTIFIGIAVSIKRLFVALFLGRQTFGTL